MNEEPEIQQVRQESRQKSDAEKRAELFRLAREVARGQSSPLELSLLALRPDYVMIAARCINQITQLAPGDTSVIYNIRTFAKLNKGEVYILAAEELEKRLAGVRRPPERSDSSERSNRSESTKNEFGGNMYHGHFVSPDSGPGDWNNSTW